jgi:thiamine biosynthesis lipoprotein
VLDVGGNLRIVGAKPDGNGWITGIKDPHNASKYAEKLTLSDISCVTSGDYERYFEVDGIRYHHIIDKDTLYPAEHFSSVTVICRDSGLADALSTALFCMSYEEGRALVDALDSVEVIWVTKAGGKYTTDGIDRMRSRE